MKERTSQYWICSDCAEKKGWKCVEYAITVIHGLCGWCGRKDVTTLIPTCDFNKPGGKKALWD